MIAGLILAFLISIFLIMIISFTFAAKEREIAFRKTWLKENLDNKVLPFKDKEPK